MLFKIYFCLISSFLRGVPGVFLVDRKVCNHQADNREAHRLRHQITRLVPASRNVRRYQLNLKFFMQFSESFRNQATSRKLTKINQVYFFYLFP
jgi:hypothetical protein